ncbi:hypothetical protein EDC56_3169 [Sinobacterium caligoides]|uniref:Pyridoxal phosphate homeostasis protein n=1 Tax=Sinobacterium caligoides TaxID=933926 RepID=A0A3N2DGP5_9GAMM|nr:YggS family pyridoxal phosphate-dependent enzyme [Sinobacterium caligoides]ROR98929.1 hypothetical protein EDC56_3169 [Sinobacterium caligoides]
MPKIADNLEAVYQRIGKACEKAGRQRDEVQLLAVSKTRSASEVLEAYDYGCRDFGENYLQDALEKITEIKPTDIHWHFIGHLQSNKTRQVAEHFQWMHTVDRLKIAQRLNDQRPAQLPPLNICLQVNISGEDSKAGIDATELLPLAAKIESLEQLQLRGLMVIPAASQEVEQQRRAFAESRQLFSTLQAQHPQVDTLSMGMSGDLDSAILEGSTMVRIGTDIFGARAQR